MQLLKRMADYAGDTSGTRVQVYAGSDKPVAEWWIDVDEVYAVEGYLNSQFNRSFNDWRNKTFLRLKKSNNIRQGYGGFRFLTIFLVTLYDE